MSLRKVPLSEAKDLPLGFDITEELLDKTLPQLDAILRQHGWTGPEDSASSSVSATAKKSKSNN